MTSRLLWVAANLQNPHRSGCGSLTYKMQEQEESVAEAGEVRGRQARFLWDLLQWEVVVVVLLAYTGYRIKAAAAEGSVSLLMITYGVIGPLYHRAYSVLFPVLGITSLLWFFASYRKFRLFPADEFSRHHWIPKVALLFAAGLVFELALAVIVAVF